MESKSNILILTNHFYPEEFRVNDIAFELAKRNYAITVITAIPDYPIGKFFSGYSLIKRRREKIGDVRIIRLPIIPRGSGRKLQLSLNYLSYLISSLFLVAFHALDNDYDAVMVHMTSPFFITFPAVYLKRIKKMPLILWVLDLWPESVEAAGGIKDKNILGLLNVIVKKVYQQCNTILVSSNSFKKSISQKGNFEKKLVYFPNWADSIPAIDIDKQYKNISPFSNKSSSDFIFLFAGNLGEAQNIDFILDSISKMDLKKGVKFVFLGDGRKRAQLIKKSNSLGLSEICYFPGRFPQTMMPYFMGHAEVMLASLKSDAIFSLTVPAKVQFYMAQGKPILAILNGEGAEIINRARCGIATKPDDIQGFQNALSLFLGYTKEELYQMGENGKKYYLGQFDKEKRLDQIDGLLRKVTNNNRDIR